VISIPAVLLAVYVLNMPLPAPWIDKRAHPLAIKLADAFPELKNLGDGPDKATVSWDIADIGAKTVATFRVSNVGAKDRQDQILRYLEANIFAEPISQIDLVFYWKDGDQMRQSRKERVEKKELISERSASP